MKEKPVLINGFPRSGTTFLYKVLCKNLGTTFYEPLNPLIGYYITSIKKGNIRKLEVEVGKIHPKIKHIETLFKPYLDIFGEAVYDIIKHNPNIKDGKHHFIYKYSELVSYLSYFKGYNIKEISLHFYLKELSKWWNIYHIIRNPADVFLSIIATTKDRKLNKIIKLPSFIRSILKLLLSISFDLYNIETCARELYNLYGGRITFNDFLEMFIYTWTISNYFAINTLGEKYIIVYNDLETFKKVEFMDKNDLKNIRIKKYRGRYLYMKKFDKITKKIGIYEEYKEVMKLFNK